MSNTLIQSYLRAIKASVPLLGITTPDPAITIETLVPARPEALRNQPYSILQWDVARGVTLTNMELRAEDKDERGLNSQRALQVFTKAGSDPATATALKNLPFVLSKMAELPKDTIVFVHNAHRFLHDTNVIQAIWHLRDIFKAAGQMLVLLGPSLKLPAELVHDVIILDDPLPNRTQLQTLVSKQMDNIADILVDGEELPPVNMEKTVDAVLGLSSFEAEQALAMSSDEKGIDLPLLWHQKYTTIEQTPGLKIYRGPETFSDIGGVTFIKSFLTKILNGRNKPGAIIFLDELEKSVAGANSAHGDNTGVSQDIHKQLLEHMQNTDATGIIMLGPPGTSKSLVSKAAGNEGGIPTIEFDLGGVKSSSVGASEQNMRHALKVITSISNGSALYLATCNSMAAISPELRRRFRLGTFMFPLPTREEREAIWKIYSAKYELPACPEALLQEEWTGAEIRQCADIAWRLSIPLEEAAQYIVPVGISARQAIHDLYVQADGAYLCAAYPGPFKKDRTEQPAAQAGSGSRRMRVVQSKASKAAAQAPESVTT